VNLGGKRTSKSVFKKNPEERDSKPGNQKEKTSNQDDWKNALPEGEKKTPRRVGGGG